MFAAAGSGAGPRRRTLLALDVIVTLLAAVDMGVGVLREARQGPPLAGPAVGGALFGACGTLCFGALCLCWDEAPPRPVAHLVVLGLSVVGVVGSVLLAGRLEWHDAPRGVPPSLISPAPAPALSERAPLRQGPLRAAPWRHGSP